MSSSHEHHHQSIPAAHEHADEWHDHSHETAKPKAEPYGEVANAGKIILTGIALWLFIVVAVVVVYGYYTYDTTIRLAQSERASSIGPAVDALTYKRQALQNQLSGGEVYSQVVRGETVSYENVPQLPIFDPAKPEVINEVKRAYRVMN